MKVVINQCFGGYGLSDKAYELLGQAGFSRQDTIPRHDPNLVRVVEILGKEANASYSNLQVIEIPFDSEDGWSIEEYDGFESIHENHQSWG